MSSDAFPISAGRFAEALQDLSLSSLHLKVLEIRNSIAHLDYSNEQLRPFAEGTEATLDAAGQGEPDQDCVDAIKENELVIGRMQDRIRLIRVEVEARGGSWTEFQSKEELDAEQAPRGLTNGQAAADAAPSQNDSATGSGGAGAPGRHQAWTDGTFQTGSIRNGEVRTDGQQPQAPGGGRLTDEQLRRALEERLREDHDEDDDGMHL